MTEFTPAHYQIGLLGASREISNSLKKTVRDRLVELGVAGGVCRFFSGKAVAKRDRRLPFVVVYFGQSEPTSKNIKLINELMLDSPVVIPVVDKLARVNIRLPSALKPINCLEIDPADTGFEHLTNIILQQFRLLRQDRRVFISYRRESASSIAAQIYDALDAKGFDVFLDTRSVPPAEDFQEVLWHRMADSDVVILLDTPGFSDSRWTMAELARANSTNIQILQLIWPESVVQKRSALSHLELLASSSFRGGKKQRRALLKASVVARLCVAVESLRARAIGARHRFLVDAFCDLARSKGLVAVVYPDRSIRVAGPSGSVAVVPLVGIPSSVHLEDHFAGVGGAALGSEIYVMYDERGLLKRFKSHLGWLNNSLPIKSVGVFEANKVLDEVA